MRESGLGVEFTRGFDDDSEPVELLRNLLGDFLHRNEDRDTILFAHHALGDPLDVALALAVPDDDQFTHRNSPARGPAPPEPCC